MNKIRTLSPALLLVLAATAIAQEAKITVRVMNEVGTPVTNAAVTAAFATAIKPGWGWGSGRPNEVTGQTGTNGLCTLTGDGNGGSVAVAVKNAGYYGSSGYQLQFTNLVGTAVRKWQPWNPTIDVVLKPIGNPTALCAKRVWQMQVPQAEPVGYDLLAGDWVAPHGKGKTSDFLLRYASQPETTIETRYGPAKTSDRTLMVTFSNESDGVLSVTAPARGGSALRLSPAAPLNAYSTNIIKRVVEDQRGLVSDIREDQNYFFRVRTKKDDKGNIVSALYGKIYGDVQFDERGRVTFTYYLNPTPNDRNVEFDPAKNLFTDLSSREQVHEP